ncbi:hypothetical protein C8F04DRAFT_1264669 [Mycena alexandri]|uniref:Secreted protein n=1 Tax=Mycena alexandri TaxID=1745969 RepID=A0AAD6WYB5_9AGAR|nr:hypothetical protein C8F04DRAFT_1264669 [Mycena alexandri]
MLFPPAVVVLSAIAYAVASLHPGSEVLTAAPEQLTAAPVPAPELSFTVTCQCQTIPFLTTTFCLPCSTIFFTGTDTTTTTPAPTARLA